MPSIAFDIIGTCFDYGAAQKAIEERLGDKFHLLGIHPGLFYCAWRFLADRDSTFLRMIGGEDGEKKKIISFKEVLKFTFSQTLLQSGVLEPSLISSFCSEQDLNFIVEQYGTLQPRKGMEEMFQILQENKFTIWACSDAEVERVQNCFKQTSIEMPNDKIISAHSIGYAKPQKQVYQTALKIMKDCNPDENIFIFAAAHAYDLAAARKHGFQTAFCTIYEGKLVNQLWGNMDIVQPTLPDLARAIVEKYSEKGATM